jgi:hypothetical protein
MLQSNIRGVKMSDKSAKLATFLFMGIFALPILGLLIMDYQVKQANDITGSYGISDGANYDHALAGVLIVGIGVIVFTVFTMAHAKKVRSADVNKGSSVMIDDKIRKIDEELKKSKL